MYPLKIKEKYDPKNLANLSHRFSVPYMGNYIPGNMDEYSGSHLAVDIVPETSNQEVLAPLDGEVFKTGEGGAYGKFIVIKHILLPDPNDFSKKTNLYSSFEHLSDVKVKIGDKLVAGDIIGNTGNTGNSFGEHLHFQIDREEAPFKPYWPYTGNDVKNAGISFSEGVNQKLGYENALKYTINPLVYLDSLSNQKNLVVENKDIETPKKVEEKIVVEIPKEIPLTGNIVNTQEVASNLNNLNTPKKEVENITPTGNNIIKEEKLDVTRDAKGSNIISNPLLEELKKKDL
ncbi:M23 family metallopeptidase [Candidatus Gracilibacteria bacterium]|nr:M23 family metallopeptidase [Candidatus Gracilibacteria bacterium]